MEIAYVDEGNDIFAYIIYWILLVFQVMHTSLIKTWLFPISGVDNMIHYLLPM